MTIRLDYLVVRVHDLQASKEFYELLGMKFTQEKHGSGPEHYACVLDDDTVFELYPGGNLVTRNIRIALKVENLRTIRDNLERAGYSTGLYDHSADGVVFQTITVYDPDGTNVRISAYPNVSQEASKPPA